MMKVINNPETVSGGHPLLVAAAGYIALREGQNLGRAAVQKARERRAQTQRQQPSSPRPAPGPSSAWTNVA